MSSQRLSPCPWSVTQYNIKDTRQWCVGELCPLRAITSQELSLDMSPSLEPTKHFYSPRSALAVAFGWEWQGWLWYYSQARFPMPVCSSLQMKRNSARESCWNAQCPSQNRTVSTGSRFRAFAPFLYQTSIRRIWSRFLSKLTSTKTTPFEESTLLWASPAHLDQPFLSTKDQAGECRGGSSVCSSSRVSFSHGRGNKRSSVLCLASLPTLERLGPFRYITQKKRFAARSSN